jgi:hypothetical protein
VASPLDYLFGVWKSYPFAIWTPLPSEQAAVQLERSLGNPRWDTPRSGWLVLHGSVVKGSFTVVPGDRWFRNQQPVITGQVVSAPAGGSHVVGELAYRRGDKELLAAVPVIMIAVFGLCGISVLVSKVSWTSAVIAAATCVGVPTLCLTVLSVQTNNTMRYHEKLRAHLCSVLHGVDVTAQEQGGGPVGDHTPRTG